MQARSIETTKRNCFPSGSAMQISVFLRCILRCVLHTLTAVPTSGQTPKHTHRPPRGCSMGQLMTLPARYPIMLVSMNHRLHAPAALASLIFDPLEPQYIGNFSSPVLCLLPFSSLTLPTSAFPSSHIVRSLSSKLH